jgi:hypothetical protein
MNRLRDEMLNILEDWNRGIISYVDVKRWLKEEGSKKE